MNTVRIAVCDDSFTDVQKLENYLQKYAKENGYNFTVDCFYSGQDFIKRYWSGYQIIFLDIRLSDITGDNIAEKIRKKDKNIPIIFVSSFPDAVYRGYELNIQNYIRKPVPYKAVAKEVERALRSFYYFEEAFFWEDQVHEPIKIYYAYLEYIETDTQSRYTLLHYDSHVILSRRKIKEYESLLQKQNFFRCNNSYIVNLYFIKKIIPCDRRYDIMLLNGEKIPMSRGNKEECMKRLIALNGYM